MGWKTGETLDMLKGGLPDHSFILWYLKIQDPTSNNLDYADLLYDTKSFFFKNPQ